MAGRLTRQGSDRFARTVEPVLIPLAIRADGSPRGGTRSDLRTGRSTALTRATHPEQQPGWTIRDTPGTEATLVLRTAWTSTIESIWVEAGKPRISFVPGPEDTLDWVPDTPITRLIVVGPLADHRGVQAATQLEELELATGLSDPLDLSRLTLLRRFSGADVCHFTDSNTSLEWLALSDFRSPTLEDLPIAQLRLLRLMPARRLRDIGTLARARHLVHLGIGWAPLDDWAPLETCLALRELELVSCRQMQDLSVVARLPRLEILELENCRSLRTLDPLRSAQRLRCLSLRGRQGIDDGAFAFLLNLPALEMLSVEVLPRGSDLAAKDLDIWRARRFAAEQRADRWIS